MDIHENIRKIRAHIIEENADALIEQINILGSYVYKNIDALKKDNPLKAQIADCFFLGGNKTLELLPNRYLGYYHIAISHFLQDDVQGLCQNLTIWLDEDRKAGGKPFSFKEYLSYYNFFYCRLTNKAAQVFWDSMIRAYERSFPDTAATYYIRSLDEKLDKEQIIHYLSKTIERDEEFFAAFYDIALLYENDKNWKNAISYYNRCIGLNPKHAQTHSRLAWCYGKIKEHDREIAAYEKCLELDPETPYALNNLGWAYERTKDYDKALYYYQQSIESGRDGTYPFRNTFQLLKKLKRYDEAIAFGEANKKKLAKKFQKEIEALREAKNTDALPQDLQEDAEEERAVISEPEPQKRTSRATNTSFLAESRLEDEIEACLNKGMPFFGLPLAMYDRDDGYGRQYIIPGIGRIDLLAVHMENNDFYVIELKKGLGDDEVVGQVSRYMGWVKKHLAADGQNVYGIICVSEVSDRLKYAVDAHPNISVFRYSLQITPA